MPFIDGAAQGCAPPMFSAGLGLYCIFKFPEPLVALWNPATREIKTLPPSPFYRHNGDYVFGFGLVEYVKEDQRISYKVGLLSIEIVDQPSFTVELYDSSTHSWKLLVCDIAFVWNPEQYHGVNLNGAFHFLSDPEDMDPYIIVFHYASEVFSTIELPALPQIDGWWYNIDCSHLCLYDDKSLCLILARATYEKHVFYDAWVMHEYGVRESWVKEFTTGPVTGAKEILNYSKSIGQIFLLGYSGGTRMYLCNCASSAVANLHLIDSKAFEFIFVLERRESLVSIIGSTSDKSLTLKISKMLWLLKKMKWWWQNSRLLAFCNGWVA